MRVTCHYLIPADLGLDPSAVSDAEIAECREIFQLVDLDHGGTIDIDELNQLMLLLGMNVMEEELDEMVEEIDTTGTHEVSFADFVRIFSKKVDQSKYDKDILLSSFAKFENGAEPGFIHKNDMTRVLLKHPSIDAEKAADMVAQMEPDRLTGMVNYHTYVEQMLGVSQGGGQEG